MNIGLLSLSVGGIRHKVCSRDTATATTYVRYHTVLRGKNTNGTLGNQMATQNDPTSVLFHSIGLDV